MSPVFSARRRADEFDSLVEAAASGRRVEDARFAELLEIVGALREAPAPQASSTFVSGLRDQLMAAAADELGQVAPSVADRLTVAPPKTSRERRLAIAVGAVAIVGATTSMAVAAQSTLPGDVLYPLKRALENAQTGVRIDEAAKGSSLLANARGRLSEIDELTRSADGQDLAAITTTLEAFAEQATEASDLLLADYAETGSEESVVVLQDFTAQSLAVLEEFSAVLPAPAQQPLVETGELLALIAQTTVSLCPTCTGEQIDRIPSFLVQAAKDVIGKVVSPKPDRSAVSPKPGKPSGSSQASVGGAPEEGPASASPSSPTIEPPAGNGSSGGPKDEDGVTHDEEPLGLLEGVLGGGSTPTSGPTSQESLVGEVVNLLTGVLGPGPAPTK